MRTWDKEELIAIQIIRKVYRKQVHTKIKILVLINHKAWIRLIISLIPDLGSVTILGTRIHMGVNNINLIKINRSHF